MKRNLVYKEDDFYRPDEVSDGSAGCVPTCLMFLLGFIFLLALLLR